MINVLFRPIAFLFSLALIGFLVYGVFFKITDISHSSELLFGESNTYSLNLDSDDSDLFLPYDENASGSLVQTFGYVNKVFSYSGTTTIEQKDNTISLAPGVYIFDIRDPNTQYSIKSDGFVVHNVSSGLFIINNSQTNKVSILSVSGILGIDFTKKGTPLVLTQTQLYPHSYIHFNIAKNVAINKGDLLKISQRFLLDTFNSPLLDDGFLLKEEITKIISFDPKQTIFFNNTLGFIKKFELKNTLLFQELSGSSVEEVFGKKYIEEYPDFLYNKQKQSQYLQNNIVELFFTLSGSTGNDETIKQIGQDLDTLKSTDIQAHSAVVKKLYSFYNVILHSQNIKQTSLLRYSRLFATVGQEDILFMESYIEFERMYRKYNFHNSVLSLGIIDTFLGEYTSDSNTVSIKTDALLFYLNAQLVSEFAQNNVETHELIQTLNRYIGISNSFYGGNSESIVKTGLFYNSKILSQLSAFLEKNYFEDKKIKNLYVKNKSARLDKKQIAQLRSIHESLLGFFEKNKYLLDTKNVKKDQFLATKYKYDTQKAEEIFFALSDYESYLVKYDPSKLELLENNSIFENQAHISVSFTDAQNYLGGFQGVQKNNMNIAVRNFEYCSDIDKNTPNSESNIEKYCYEIKNLDIQNNLFSFLLFPYENNRISDISINNKPFRGEYVLDQTKKDYIEAKKIDQGDTTVYDFSYFFVNTFLKNNIKNIEIFTYNGQEDSEDRIITVFKKNKLLGETGDFTKLSGFIKILYNKIIIIQKDSKYNITVANNLFQLTSSQIPMYGYFTGEYDFDTHSFLKISLSLTDQKSENSLIHKGNITINSPTEITKVEELFSKVTLQKPMIIKLSEAIYSKHKQEYINYIFNPNTGTISISYIYNNKIVEIQSNNGIIKRFNYDNKSLVTTGKKIELIHTLFDQTF